MRFQITTCLVFALSSPALSRAGQADAVVVTPVESARREHAMRGAAQGAPSQPRQADIIKLAGPRFGVTFLSEGIRDKLRRSYIDVGPAVTQIGWQFEKRFYSSASGLTAVTEWVPLLGGLDQNAAIPSLNWLVGFRTLKGIEFAAGPNFTPAGSAFVIAAGMTIQTGTLNIPVNLAVVPSKSGVRVSVLSGFNTRR